VGLVSCHNTPDNDLKTNRWVGCQEPDLDYLTRPMTNCKCDATKAPLFVDYNTLESIGRLPTTSGGTLSYFRGFKPTGTTAPVSTSTDSVPNAAATLDSMPATAATSDVILTVVSPSPTSAESTVDPTETPDVDEGMSINTKVGIGAGAGLGVVCAALIAIMVFRMYKRRRNYKRRESEYHEAAQLDTAISPDQSSTHLERNNTVYSGLSGYKAELAADATPASAGDAVSPLTLNPLQLQDQQRQYQAYHPDVHSRCSVRSDVSAMNPSPVQSESTQTMGPTPSPLTAGTQHTMGIIAELEG
jgi:hypothetical protein